jgi:hypothetical protein
MNIPIIINNRNWLTTTKKLVEDLTKLGYNNIIILDNDSTYLPLLEWYKDCPARVEYTGKNYGHTALWQYGILNEFKKYPFIAYTDSDIELNPNTPVGFVETLIVLAKDYRVEKAGLALHYKDIPESLANNRSRKIEERYWVNRLSHVNHNLEVYDAYIDTTFAVVKPDSTYSWAHKAIRVAGDFTCNHKPWYMNWYAPTEEQQYYIDNADSKFCSYKRLMQ